MAPFRTPALAMAACATLVLTACGGPTDDEADAAAASVENCDRDVTIDAPIERAVAINQPATEMLLSLDLQDRMVAYGVSDEGFMAHLQDAADEVDALDDEFASLESVLDLEPDLIYATFAYTFTPEGIANREAFEDVGVATYQSPSECGGQDAEQTDELTLDDMYDEIGDIATLFGVQERGEVLVEELSSRAEEVSQDLGVQDVELAWWYASTKAPFMAGCCGAPGLMTRAVGATNAFEAERQLWPEIGWESIVDADPDVLVLADLDRGDDGDSAQAKIDFLESDPAAREMTAVKEKRFIVLDGTTMDPSVRNVDGIEQLAEGLRDLGFVS
ncbi:ABC transporter substrate-binding protein [Aeromicrobium sp. CTD01-1L150]|uniref:ABC transporter substrate-binding protein n=1 Tax=Aeromicrobium sp. CTD01-1L150 TaxID=3341830 RepID=UPI0035BFAD9D